MKSQCLTQGWPTLAVLFALACCLLAACAPQSPTPPTPRALTPQRGGDTDNPSHVADSPPRIRVDAAGLTLNDVRMTVEEAVTRVRLYRREHPPATERSNDWTLVVTIEPDVRFSDERSIRSALDALADAPDQCVIEYDIPKRASFPPRGD
jgi:hypothetical protein